MIPAAEALRLPRARLSDSDAAAVEALLAEIDAHVRAHVTRRGDVVSIPAGKVNADIVGEVTHRLRKLGWVCGWQQIAGRNPITMQETIIRFDLALTPEDAAYDAVDILENQNVFQTFPESTKNS